MDKIVLVWCAQSGKNLGALRGHTQPVTCLCWQPLHVTEGDSFPFLATSSKDAAVRIWAAGAGFRWIQGLEKWMNKALAGKKPSWPTPAIRFHPQQQNTGGVGAS